MKGLTPSGTLPIGTLAGGKTAIDQGRRNPCRSFVHRLFSILAKQLIANKKKISFEEAKRLDKSNESMPPWQQLYSSSSGIGSSGSLSSHFAHGSTAISSVSSVSSPSSLVNTLAAASSGVTANLLTDSVNTNCNGNDKTSGKSTNQQSPRNRTK